MNTTTPSAHEVHRESLVVDLLDATVLPRHLPGFALERYVPRLHEGGVTAFVSCVAAHHEDDFGAAAARLVRWHRLARSAGAALQVIQAPEDLLSVKRNGQVGVIFQFQDAKPIDDNLDFLEAFHRLGLRILQLTYQRRNLVGDGCGEAFDGGLSMFGRRLVRECNRVGLIVDLAHGGHRTILDAIAASEAPVLISHTAAHRLCPHVRNVRDEHLRALAENGGVAGVHALAYLLREDGGPRGASIDDVVAHIDYMVELIGVDHVGIGTDVGAIVSPEEESRRHAAWARLGEEFPELFVPGFDVRKRYARGLESCAGLPLITRALLERGYAAEHVHKIMGGNFLRVFERVTAVAASAQ